MEAVITEQAEPAGSAIGGAVGGWCRHMSSRVGGGGCGCGGGGGDPGG